MSLNKVLNRPLFRQAALKKGYLKPIKARIGQMVGLPTGGSMAYNPNRVPMVIPQPAQQGFLRRAAGTVGRNIGSLPFLLGSELTYDALTKSDPSGNLSMPVKLGASGLAGLAANIGVRSVAPAVMSMGFLPSMVVYGTGMGLKNRYDAGKKELARIKAMSPKERAEFEVAQRAKAFNYFGEGMTDKDMFGTDKPNEIAPPKEVKPKITVKRKSNRLGFQDRLTEKENQSEVVQGDVDINKVVENNLAQNVSSPGEGGLLPQINKRPPETKIAKKQDQDAPKTDEKANVNTIKTQSNNLDKPGEIKAADGTEVNTEVIDLARKYRKELMAGQKSQAKLVFLSNLASGLLTGTTTKGGLGGALEVFGQALGPAVNNYATIKLKENEMENEFMSDALELAQDELAAKNDLVEGTSGLDFESTGYIQFRDKNGKAINRTGGLLKDGTYVMAALGQVDANGRQVYVPVAAGTFSKYFTSAFGEKEQGQTIRNLSGKYKALGIGKETIRILEEAAAKGETLGGPVGRFNLLTTRLGSALEDLGFSMFESKDAGMAKVNQMRESFKSELMNDGMSEKEANAFLDKNFGSVDSQFKKTLKDLGIFADQSKGADLERLAINETVLTYALANSLKDKDRLTQKDIQMAKELVNVFPLLRGQKQVVRSLEAVNERILGDIEASELIYSEFGGDTATLENFRRKYGLLPGVDQEQVDVGFQNESTIDLLEKLGQI
jgi:hypothetical protein